MSGYGVLPGFAVAGLEHTGDLLTAMNWQGRRLDPTGFYDMGARFYDPEGRKFLSPDPLGHASSMDLYNYTNGDPINHIDPDGRLARMIGGAISATFEFLGGMGDAAREMSEFVGGTTVDLFRGRMPNGSGPSAESVEIFNQIMVGVQIAAIPLSFIGGPVGIIAMGVGSFASLTQGDLAGAVMGMAGGIGRMGTFAVRTAGATVRAEAGLMSAGGVGRNFAGTASKPWGAAASRSLGTLDSGGTTTLNYNFNAARGGRVPTGLIAGQRHETEQLAALGKAKNTAVWRPTKADMDSAAFKVIVGDAKFTKGGLPRGTIFDSVDGGLLEIKGGGKHAELFLSITLADLSSVTIEYAPDDSNYSTGKSGICGMV